MSHRCFNVIKMTCYRIHLTYNSELVIDILIYRVRKASFIAQEINKYKYMYVYVLELWCSVRIELW